MNIQKQVQLQNRNTLAVPSVAEFFCECACLDEISEVLSWAKSKKMPWRILAGGSNVILAETLPGLTLVPAIQGMQVVSENDESIHLRIGAGENWHKTVVDTVNKGCYGLENLALIPGTVGAAPVQNIGAYGVELEEFVVSVSVLDTHSMQKQALNKEQCEFSYRDSLFKKAGGEHYIICDLDLVLSKKFSPQLAYPALNRFLEKNKLEASAKNVLEAVVNIRQSKLPDPKYIPNAGSFFKNPLVTQEKFENLKNQFPEIPGYRQLDGNYKLAAAWLIEQCGWKGKTYKGVTVHQDHSLVVTNPNSRPSENILQLAAEISKDVFERFKLDLDREPRLLV